MPSSRWPTNTWKNVQHDSSSGKYKSKPQWDTTSHLSEWLNINNSGNNRCWRGCGERGSLLHCCWECKLVQPLWKTVWRFLKKLKIELPYDPATALLGIYPRDTGMLFQRDACTPMFIAALSTIAKVWKESKCPLTDERVKMWYIGASGWLSWLSVQLQLRSWPHTPWVRAPSQALCWQLRAWSPLQILCLPLSLPLPCSCSFSLKYKIKNIKKKSYKSFKRYLKIHFFESYNVWTQAFQSPLRGWTWLLC